MNQSLSSTSVNQRTLSRKYESLDYDEIENVIHLEYQHNKKSSFISPDLQRWIVIFLIGIATALSGFAAGFAVNTLTRRKFLQIIHTAESNCPKNSTIFDNITCFFLPYVIWIAWNVIPSALGSILVTYFAPVAAGSGIPVVKCYLNGVNIPEVVRLKTYLAKIVGVVNSVVGGLAVGKEGPFVHCGAAIGAGISQGRCTSLGVDTGLFKTFRNDRDKRDFVSAGASAGVACAFGAPIGGLLFALEEGASFWDQMLTWRIFFCSMVTSFTLNLALTAYDHNGGILAFNSLVNFGLVEELDYFWFEVPIYIMIAILGGLTGASFCYFNLLITRFRKQYINKNWMKVMETIAVAIVSATVGVMLILFASDCQPYPSHGSNNLTRDIETISIQHLENGPNYGFFETAFPWNRRKNPIKNDVSNPDKTDVVEKALKNHVLTFMCPEGHYSAMSSLWLKTSEGASSTFMVIEQDIWSIQSLTLFLVVYYFLAIWTYGLSISSGVFIPSLLVGAVGGRLIGKILGFFFGSSGNTWLVLQPNKFAIIGAASVLGGVVRMTISLTVIIIEATGAISFGLPIMICLMTSKWIADWFIDGLYDLAIHMSNVPFLGWNPPVKSYSIYATDVMSPNVVVLKTTETVGNLIRILKATTHNGFPVVDFDSEQEMEELDRLNTERSATEYFSAQATTSNVENLFTQQSSTSIPHQNTPAFNSPEDLQIGSFQRCLVTRKRRSHGRYRGLVLRSQLIVMLQYSIFNENERSYDSLSMPIFSESYPQFPDIDEVALKITEEMYPYHVDLRSIMNSAAYTVLYSASFPRIYTLFRSLGLRHLTVTDDRNEVVGIVTRKDLARYVRERGDDGQFKFHELQYSL